MKSLLLWYFFSGNKASTIIGTCNYLAPELCNGNEYNSKTDIWALGCVLYELCAMERMFSGTVSKFLLLVFYLFRNRCKLMNIFLRHKNIGFSFWQVSNVVLSIASGRKKQVNTKMYGRQMQEIIDMMLQANPDNRPTTKDLITDPDVFSTLYALGPSLGCIDE